MPYIFNTNPPNVVTDENAVSINVSCLTLALRCRNERENTLNKRSSDEAKEAAQ